MDELQNRMFHLADLTPPGAEPDDAAKLLLAVRSAREQLILEQMRSNIDLLNGKDFTHAADEQAHESSPSSEELQEAFNLGRRAISQMLLEKLRAIDQSVKKLDAATTEEKRQTDVAPSERKARTRPANPKPADPKPLDNLKQDQQQNRKATDSIAQAVKGLGGSAAKAGESLGSASQSMAMAEGMRLELGQSRPMHRRLQQDHRRLQHAGGQETA